MIQGGLDPLVVKALVPYNTCGNTHNDENDEPGVHKKIMAGSICGFVELGKPGVYAHLVRNMRKKTQD